jgi:polyisoprenoid-binding protein YceI
MRIAAVALACSLSPAVVAQQPESVARYAIDPGRSTITWDVPATLHTVHGKAPELSGSVHIDTDSQGAVLVHGRVAVRAAAMKTGNESRDKTMREKVLETEQYPEIVFEVDRVEADWTKLAANERLAAKVSGRLTVHGKSLPIEVVVSVEPSAEGVMLSGTFALRWKAYGLYDPSFGIVTVRGPMSVMFRLRAVPAEDTPK